MEEQASAQRWAIVTVNSLMRNAKSLSGKKLLPFIEQSITLPRLHYKTTGILLIPTPAKQSAARKSIWTTTGLWLSKPPESRSLPAKNLRQKNSWHSRPQSYVPSQ